MNFKLHSLFFLIISFSIFSQNTNNGISNTFTEIISGTNQYKGGTYEYEAEIKFLVMNMGLGDAIVKVGIISFTIENFYYKGVRFRYNSDYNFTFPLKNAANQFRVSGALGLNRGSSGHIFDWYDFMIPMCQKGALDIYYFKEEEAKEIIAINFKDWTTKKSRMDELLIKISSLNIIPEGLRALDTKIEIVDKSEKNSNLVSELKNKLHKNYNLNENQVKKNIIIYKKLIELDKPIFISNHKENLKSSQITLKNIKISKSIANEEREITKNDKEKFANEIKRGEKKAERESKKMMQKMRLEQSAYSKNISKYKSLGFNEAGATSMANLDKTYAKMDKAGQQMGALLGDAIGNYFEAKENKRAAIEFERQSYIKSFPEFSKKIEKNNNTNISKIIAQYFPENYKPKSITDQKQRILAFITTLGNISFPNETNTGSKDMCIIKQQIEDVYFEGSKMFINYSHEIQNSEYDNGSYWDDKFRIKKYKAYYTGYYDYEKNEKRIEAYAEYPNKRYPDSGTSRLPLIRFTASGNKGYQDFYYKRYSFLNLKIPKEIIIYNEQLIKSIEDHNKEQSLIKKEFNNEVNGLAEGPWELYFDDSDKIYAIGNYKNGVKEGFWKFYHENGNLKMEANLVNGNLRGFVKKYYNNNILQSEYTIVRDSEDFDIIAPFEGIYKYYDRQGTLTSSFYYKDGLLEGLSIKREEQIIKGYNNNNPFTVTIEKQFKKGKLDGLLRIYKEDNTTLQETNYKKGIKEGLHKSYHNKGSLSQISFYKDGSLHGQIKNYDVSGKLRMSREYTDGKRTGTWREVDTKGRLYKTQEYLTIDTINKEIFTLYYSNGIVKEKIEYIIFQKENKINYFYFNRLELNNTDGSKRKKGTILNGDGTVINYDKNGLRIGKTKYKNGVKS